MQDVERMISMVKTAESLKDLIKELPLLRKGDRSYNDIDKHRDGFGKNESMGCVVIRNLCYYSYSGCYGNSSVTSDINGNTDIIEQYLLEYLNEHKDEIMSCVADLILKDAEKMKEQALKELQGYIEKINKIDFK